MSFCCADSTFPEVQTSPSLASALVRVDETRSSYAVCAALFTCQPKRGVTSRSFAVAMPLTVRLVGAALARGGFPFAPMPVKARRQATSTNPAGRRKTVEKLMEALLVRQDSRG